MKQKGKIYLLLLFALLLFFYYKINIFNYHHFHIISLNSFTKEAKKELPTLLNRVENYLAKDTLFNKKDQFFIFLINNPTIYKLIGLPFNINNCSFAFTFSSFTFINRAKILENRIYNCNNWEYLDGNLLHELTHQLQFKRFGIKKILKIPHWEKEGYAIYKSKDLSHIYSESNILKDRGKSKEILNAILIQYLIEIKNLSFKEIVEKKFDKSKLKKETSNIYFDYME